MILRLRAYDFINLSHAALGERLPGGGMRVHLINTQPRDLDPDDADRIRRRLIEIDPETLPDEGPGSPIGGAPRTRVTEDMPPAGGGSVGEP